MSADIRWQQRFQNLSRATRLLSEPIERGLDTLSLLEKEGTVQRFEVTLELSWKTLKDFLEYNGTVISPMTPRNVVKEAFAAKILEDGQVWIDMLAHRNLLAHTYDTATFESAVDAIRDRYYPAILSLHDWLQTQVVDP